MTLLNFAQRKHAQQNYLLGRRLRKSFFNTVDLQNMLLRDGMKAENTHRFQKEPDTSIAEMCFSGC